MRFLKTAVLIVALQSVLVLDSPGQSPSSTQPVAAPSPAATATPTPLPAVEVLQAQLASSEKYNDRILATIYWFLGSMASIVGIFQGVGLYRAIKLRSSEKAVLLAEITTRIEQVEIGLKEQINTALAKIQEDAAEIGRVNFVDINSVAKDHAKQITILDHRVTFSEAEGFIRDGNIADALASLSRCASLAFSIDLLMLVKDDLNRMAAVLDDPKLKAELISSVMVMAITANLKNLPGTVGQTVQRIKAELNNRIPKAGPMS